MSPAFKMLTFMPLKARVVHGEVVISQGDISLASGISVTWKGLWLVWQCWEKQGRRRKHWSYALKGLSRWRWSVLTLTWFLVWNQTAWVQTLAPTHATMRFWAKVLPHLPELQILIGEMGYELLTCLLMLWRLRHLHVVFWAQGPAWSKHSINTSCYCS